MVNCYAMGLDLVKLNGSQQGHRISPIYFPAYSYQIGPEFGFSVHMRSVANGSCVSAGLIVSQIDGGFFFIHIPQMSARILIRDSSVPIILALTVDK